MTTPIQCFYIYGDFRIYRWEMFCIVSAAASFVCLCFCAIARSRWNVRGVGMKQSKVTGFRHITCVIELAYLYFNIIQMRRFYIINLNKIYKSRKSIDQNEKILIDWPQRTVKLDLNQFWRPCDVMRLSCSPP